ncbi:MAG: RpiB/LacA/LacB family sugar-phosphate isomerase [bacterium]|nr:RpiB/LacA/LacB family sugar-phosphate isomerase [bacterium]
MKVFVASDHAGFELKEKLILFLKELGHEVQDMGAFEYNKDDDYPDFIKPLAEEVSQNPESRGIILGKSGQGEAMCANRVKSVRAAVYYGGSPDIIKLSREHNDANVLSLATGFIDEATARVAVKDWLETPFSQDERHGRRIKKLDE